MIDGKVHGNTYEYTTAFLHSDWLYFLWHDIKQYTRSEPKDMHNVWFQKISIPPPWRELEIPKGRGGGVKNLGNSRGEGVV